MSPTQTRLNDSRRPGFGLPAPCDKCGTVTDASPDPLILVPGTDRPAILCADCASGIYSLIDRQIKVGKGAEVI